MANRWNTLLVLGWDMKQLLFESIGGGGAIFLYRVGGNIFWKVTFQICFNVYVYVFIYNNKGYIGDPFTSCRKINLLIMQFAKSIQYR